MKRRIAVLALAFFFAVSACSFAETVQLSDIVKGGSSEVNVFVKGFTNEAGDKKIIAEDFKKNFENALLNRKSITFKISDNPASSDIQISGIIKKYQYLENDPINSFAGAGGLLLDAATTENYAELEVEITVTNSRTNKVIWHDTVVSYIERMMTPEESVQLVYNKVSRNFLWKCFGKPRQ